MLRPYKFLATEPIVLFLSLLSGFSDALIFTGLDSFPLVLAKWDFTVIEVGLAFFPLLAGYVVAYLMFLPRYQCDIKLLRENRPHSSLNDASGCFCSSSFSSQLGS